MRLWIALLLLSTWLSPAWGHYLVVRTTAVDTTFVTVIDTEGAELSAQTPLPPVIGPTSGKAEGIVWDGGAYLLSDNSLDRVWAVSGDLQTAEARFTTPPFPGGLALHDDDLFLKVNVSDRLSDVIYRLDAMTGAIDDTLDVPESIPTIQDLTSDGEQLWAVDTSTPRVWRIDLLTRLFEDYHPLPSPLFLAIAWDPENEWLWLVESGTPPAVHRMDPVTGDLTLEFSFDDGDDWYLYQSATFRGDLTPTRRVSWGEVKDGFRPRR